MIYVLLRFTLYGFFALYVLIDACQLAINGGLDYTPHLVLQCLTDRKEVINARHDYHTAA